MWCPAHVKLLAHTPCVAAGFGYPLAWHWFTGYAQQYGSNDNLRWLYVLTPRGLQVAPFATGWLLWSAAIFLVLFFVCLDRSRLTPSLPQWYAAEPSSPGP